jgi:hypothetical protein
MSDVATAADRAKQIAVADDQVLGGLPEGYAAGNQNLAVALARAEIDQQIVTARAMPRQITRAVQNITTLATLDEQTAEECIYALTRGGKAIKGPSIRLAEIIMSQWGNCRVGTRIVHVDLFEKYIEAEGVFHDLETNTATTARVRRRISDKKGRVFSEDMIIVTGNAASAIAKRNAILSGVPKGVWRKAYAMVEQVIAGDVKTLGERRDKALKAFAAFGVSPEQIFTALEVAGVDDIGIEQLSTLIGMHSAIKNNEATVEEMFPKAPAPGPRPKNLGEALDQLATPDKVEEAKPAGKPVEKIDTAAPATAAPAEKPASNETAKSNATPAVAPTTPSVAERQRLREYHHVLSVVNSRAKLSKASSEFWRESPPPEGSPLHQGMTAILGAHARRVEGEGSPADADNVAREWIAGP